MFARNRDATSVQNDHGRVIVQLLEKLAEQPRVCRLGNQPTPEADRYRVGSASRSQLH